MEADYEELMSKPVSAEAGAEIDLQAVEREVRLETLYQQDGHAARTLVRQDDLRVVMIAMKSGSRIAEHSGNASMSIQTLSGQARLRLPDRLVDLPGGQLLVLERGLTHDIEAVTDAAVLVTVGRPTHG